MRDDLQLNCCWAESEKTVLGARHTFQSQVDTGHYFVQTHNFSFHIHLYYAVHYQIVEVFVESLISKLLLGDEEK